MISRMSVPDRPCEGEDLLTHVRSLNELVNTRVWSEAATESANRALDGEAGAVVRRAFPLNVRRELGAFFTSSTLAEALVQPHATEIEAGAIVLDPACGAADLLLAAAAYVPARAAIWRRQLVGFDIHPTLIRLAEQRLLLKFRMACPGAYRRTTSSASDLRNVDFFEASSAAVRSADVILLNPPYSTTVAPPEWLHGEGSVTRAALFLTETIERARPGASISAILPDVLRSGSRYTRWRASVAKACEIREVRAIGQFDRWTDVDVFVLRLRVGSPASASAWPDPPKNDSTVDEHFNVTVGPVVPHRHADEGELHPYIHARSLAGKRLLDEFPESRGFSGPLIRPPFVAIRRTSRPGDRSRSLATLVIGERPIAVENHVICALPRDGTRMKCEQLLRVLQSSSTVEWLDERIRCRHLTVKVIREIEWNAE
jgi:hypothetical protein